MKLLCFMLAAVVLVTGCAFAEDNGGDALESILSGMTLREKAAQMMIASFRTWKEVPETEDAEQPAEEPPAVVNEVPEIAESMTDAAPAAADEIENYWHERDIKNLVVKIHAMKSSLRLIGASDAGNMAARLEKAARENDTDTLKNGLDVMLSKARHISELLEPLE